MFNTQKDPIKLLFIAGIGRDSAYCNFYCK